MSDRFQPRVEGGGGNVGISQLTQDVLAGPGSGSKAATVVGLQTRPVGPDVPDVGDVLTWDGAAWVPAASAGGSSRLVPLDAHDIVQWGLDDASSPWRDSVGTLNLVDGNTPPKVVRVSDGGAIFGARCARTSWDDDAWLQSADTIVGEGAAGTIHGWVSYLNAAPKEGAICGKDPGANSLFLGFTSAGSSGSQLYAVVGDSGSVTVTSLPYSAGTSPTDLVRQCAWTHVAITWSAGVATVYVNGLRLPATLAYSAINWTHGKWFLGGGVAGQSNALFSMWRICDVARSGAYLDEVYKRAVGYWPP